MKGLRYVPTFTRSPLYFKPSVPQTRITIGDTQHLLCAMAHNRCCATAVPIRTCNAQSLKLTAMAVQLIRRVRAS